MFFILGRPRSGTTLLSTLFDAHPNVKIPPEFPVFLNLYQKFRKVKKWDESTIRSFVDLVWDNNIIDIRTLDNLKIDPDQFTSDLLAIGEKGDIREFLAQINLHAFSVFPKQDIRAVGDKNPVYSIYAHRLVKIFPDAKFICIIRDYRDNFISILNLKELGLEAPILPLQVYRWRFALKLFLKLQQKHTDRFHLIRYEDLVNKPEQSYQELCTFLGLPYDDSVFRFSEKTAETLRIYPKELIEKFHKSLLSPINKSRMGIWKQELTGRQVRLADHIAGTYADQFSYERVQKSFDILLFLRSLPMITYGYLIFRFMQAGSYMPYKAGRWLFMRLLILVRFYQWVTGQKRHDFQKR